MSNYTIADLPRISREDLADLIRAKKPGVTVIDVRDEDYIGGHIIGCQNVPVDTHEYRMPELVRTLQDQNTIVFHCSFSQERGPASALRYLRERERMSKGGNRDVSGQKVYLLDGGFTRWQQK